MSLTQRKMNAPMDLETIQIPVILKMLDILKTRMMMMGQNLEMTMNMSRILVMRTKRMVTLMILCRLPS